MKEKNDAEIVEFVSQVIITTAVLAAIVVVVAAVIGCKPPDGCRTLEMRCRDNIVEICDEDKNWRDVQDCMDGNPGDDAFICCEMMIEGEEIPSCIPENECKEFE